MEILDSARKNEPDHGGYRRPAQVCTIFGKSTGVLAPHVRQRDETTLGQAASPLRQPRRVGPGRASWIRTPTAISAKADAAVWLAAREAEIVEHRWWPAA
ncbi:hypothetical protein GCM10009785_31260 [Brooklawnia cerclae]